MRIHFPLLLLSCALAVLAFASTSAAEASKVRAIAGNGTKGFSGDGGQASAAVLGECFGLTRGPDGALYLCDCDNFRIRRIAPDGTITTVAGNGTKGYSGDGGPALQASLNEPYEVRFDPAGNLYFVERLNHVVRRVDCKTGIISTVAGCGKEGFGGDGGPASQAMLKQPHSIGFDREGDLYICDILNNRIRKVNMKTGLISTFAGTGEKKAVADGAPVAGSPLNGPRALDFDSEGNLWLALREGNVVLKLDLSKQSIHRVAGTGKQGFAGNGGPASEATLSGPKGLSIGPDGNVYLADTESHSIRMIDLKTGTLQLIAGTGVRGDGPDGDPLACKFARPHGIFVDRDGAVYVGDSENHRVRVIRR
jgi:streptogramin lyase